MKIVITQEPVMTLTWDFNQYLNFTKETKQRQKNRRWRNVGDLSDLWPIWSNSEAGFRTHSVKLKISIIVTFYLKTLKTENRTKKTLTQFSHYYFNWRCYIYQKMLLFAKKMLTSAKRRGSCTKRYIFWNYMCVYLRTKFQVSIIILTSFRQ